MDHSEEVALAGQLGRCSEWTRAAFRALNQAINASGLQLNRQPLVKHGVWLGISFKAGGSKLLAVHPKGEWLMMDVGAANEGLIPLELRAPGVREGWVHINRTNREAGIAFSVECLRRNLARRA